MQNIPQLEQVFNKGKKKKPLQVCFSEFCDFSHLLFIIYFQVKNINPY